MEKQKYICVDDSQREQFDINRNSLGKQPDRAIYYSKTLGQGRAYRFRYPYQNNANEFKLFVLTEKQATALCKRINKAYNDNFKPKPVNV